jgi:hypothetical protein
MNLWTAEETVRAVIKELDPGLARRLDQAQLEALVESQAVQVLEDIQEIQNLNKDRSLDPEEIMEVAKQQAVEQLQERVRAGLKVADVG